MAGSVLNNLLFPPAYSEALTPAQWQRVLSFCLVFSLVAVAIDVIIGVALHGHDSISTAALDIFLIINLSLLALNSAYYAAAKRFEWLRVSWTLCVSGAIVAFGTIVWIQLTGTLTSYFIVFAVALIPVMRAYMGFGAGASVTAMLIVCHLGAVILEANGILRARSLFLSEPGQEYELAGYRNVVMLSIAWTYAFAFMSANVIVKKIREKEQALAEVRRDMARVAEGVKHGRLSGSVLCDEYALGELLGRGGMGEVYKARRISTDERVAVKVLHGHLVDDDTMLERFRREAKMAERVPEEFTARVLEVGSDDDQSLHFIAMEYLQGEDLGAYLRRRERLGVQLLIPLAESLATALDAAHAAGVVHRDLKPPNVLLVSSPAVDQDPSRFPYSLRLLDFGVSKLLGGHTVTLTQGNALLGTPSYMSPEQALGRIDDVGPAADLFALAAILYRALTGRPPFGGADLMATLRQVVNSHPPAPSSLVPGLQADVDAVFTIGMAKRMSDRYQSAAEMVADLIVAARGDLPAESWQRASRLGGLSATVLDDVEWDLPQGASDPMMDTFDDDGAITESADG